MSVVDDYGRFYARESLIRAACYPLKLNKVSDSDVGKWLTACVNAALVRMYPASDGERYLELLDFGQRIQSKSKFPAPAEDLVLSTPEHGDPPWVTVKNRLVVVEGDSPPRKRGKSPRTDMPDDFIGLSERVKQWAARKGFDRLEEHLESFRRKVAAHGYRYADWDVAFMEAIREDWAKLRGRPPPLQVAPRQRERVDL